MENKQIAHLKLHVEPEALRAIIAKGQLLEFAGTVASQAAVQISAQLVQGVANAASDPNALRNGLSAEAGFILAIANEGDHIFYVGGPFSIDFTKGSLVAAQAIAEPFKATAIAQTTALRQTAEGL